MRDLATPTSMVFRTGDTWTESRDSFQSLPPEPCRVNEEDRIQNGELMLISLTCRCPNAPEIGYLLAKNPASIFEREFSAGTVWVFYPHVAEDQITVALLTEIDPVGLVRGGATAHTLDQYVNDRPYVATSLTSVALHTAFSTALA